MLALIPALAGFAPSGGRGNLLAGSARVTSVEHMPEMDGPMCEWAPAGAHRSLYAAPGQQATREEVVQRRPLRAIGDPYGLYSAVGVDLVNDEVILQDEDHKRVISG
jgi:hypothetical protein